VCVCVYIEYHTHVYVHTLTYKHVLTHAHTACDASRQRRRKIEEGMQSDIIHMHMYITHTHTRTHMHTQLAMQVNRSEATKRKIEESVQYEITNKENLQKVKEFLDSNSYVIDEDSAVEVHMHVFGCVFFIMNLEHSLIVSTKSMKALRSSYICVYVWICIYFIMKCLHNLEHSLIVGTTSTKPLTSRCT
jgi:hypothetical protein